MLTTTKLNVVAPFALAALAVMIALIEPAFAIVPVPDHIPGADPSIVLASVPGPIVGAGLPALAILSGGYWLIRKLRERS
jgi:hypothetical protein